MRKALTTISSLLVIYFIFSSVTLFTWCHQGRYSVTGDEPHYLVMASGIVRHGTFEQTIPYREEFKTREIYKHALAPPDADPSPKNTHAAQGPNGLYNVHNIGLPLILSFSFILGGVLGAKIFMIIISGLAVVVAWQISGLLTVDSKTRFLSTLATCVALPLIPAANQIYPDILAGIIALSGIYWFMTTKMHRSAFIEGFWATAIAFLPWLQIKFAAACIILVIALTLRIYLESKDIQRVARLVFPAILSFSILAFYNHYAFGRFFGPYQSGALQLSKSSLMVLLGLHFDQNQGFLLQNPIMLVGVFSVGVLFAHSKKLTLLWLLIFISLVLPNSLHPNWYGGFSFSGRFAWAATIVFILPTLFGLVRLAEANKKAYRLMIGAAAILQLLFFYQYLSFNEIDLYNKNSSTWFSDYSIFYLPIHVWMPALYNASWAFGYGPNFAWLFVICLIFAAGFIASGRPDYFRIKHFIVFLIAGFLVVFISGFIGKPVNQTILFSAKNLPSQAGRIEGVARVAVQDIDSPGFVTFGPYIRLLKGSYRVMVRYRSLSPIDQSIGEFDIYNPDNRVQIAVYPLYGTEGKIKALDAFFTVYNRNVHGYEFRNYWNGISDIQIHAIELKRF